MPRLSSWLTQRVTLAVVILGGIVAVTTIASGGITESTWILLSFAILVGTAALLIDVVRQRSQLSKPIKFGLTLLILYLMIMLLGVAVSLIEIFLRR